MGTLLGGWLPQHFVVCRLVQNWHLELSKDRDKLDMCGGSRKGIDRYGTKEI